MTESLPLVVLSAESQQRVRLALNLLDRAEAAAAELNHSNVDRLVISGEPIGSSVVLAVERRPARFTPPKEWRVQTCDMCRYWRRLSTTQLGECRRRAPDKPGRPGLDRWPTTYSPETCGEWERGI